MSILNRIDHIPIKLMSPESVLEWSFGEVKKSETINYRTHRPEKEGLFCERIFGPVKDFHCASYCGNIKKSRIRNEICPICGVEATFSRVRRERMGHIKLEEPVAHFWFFRGRENYISSLLDLTRNDLNKIIYCNNRIVTDPGDTPLVYKQLLTELEYVKALEEYTEDNGYKEPFKAGIGAKVIKEMLEELDLSKLKKELEDELEETRSRQRIRMLKKRLEVVKSFMQSGNKPEWMILTNMPVLPPELRPMVQIDGGQFASSDINELYRNLLNRNNRLRKLKEMEAPDFLIENEMRLLQESVDKLIANSKTNRPSVGSGGRNLKSLEDLLSGKQGRFRQNLLGKRVDYSGRSVIVSGPKLRLNQCGIPRMMAIELFKPLVVYELLRQNKAINPKNASNKIDMGEKVVWEILEDVVKNHPVILNRAPTLHKLSIRAFEPVLVEGDAIQLHPLACAGFNADFDGDQMAVHLPLSTRAQLEARMLLYSTENLIHPQDGKSANTPSQDMILGCYYMSMEKELSKENFKEFDLQQVKFFSSPSEVKKSYEREWVDLHTKIILDVSENPKIKGYKYIVTTPGKVIFNDFMPDNLYYINGPEIKEVPNGVFNDVKDIKKMIFETNNEPFDRRFVGELIDYAYDSVGKEETVQMLDSLMDLGFKYSTEGGLSISLYDIEDPQEKEERLNEVDEKVKEIERLYKYGLITEESRYQRVIELWGSVGNEISNQAYENLLEDKMNSISMMIKSGARGSDTQYFQLAVMRGLMMDPNGKIIETPIKSSFAEGLTVYEYFTSTHGSRKGMVDTALKVANSGYLTRRMVDVAQDVIITEEDCGTNNSFKMTAIHPRVSSLEERLYGRFLMEDVKNDKGKVIAKKGQMISKKMAKEIAEIREEVLVRTVTVCESEGLCAKCYGMDMASRGLVSVGEAVGVIAAQSIGEPGTQLTMRTFHTGGVASEKDITQGLPRIEQIFEARKLKGRNDVKSVLSLDAGTVKVETVGVLKEVIVEKEDGESVVYNIPYGYGLLVSDGDKVNEGDPLTTGPISPHELLAVKGIDEVRKYIIEEIQKVYKSQGVTISDKHIEIIAKQMTKRALITDSGDSSLVAGRLEEINKIKKINKKLKQEDKKEIEYKERVQGITQASLSVDSFLSASSFERTSGVLSEAAIRGKKDYLNGLKESVIMGKLIPAGTGFYEYERLKGKRKN